MYFREQSMYCKLGQCCRILIYTTLLFKVVQHHENKTARTVERRFIDFGFKGCLFSVYIFLIVISEKIQEWLFP